MCKRMIGWVIIWILIIVAVTLICSKSEAQEIIENMEYDGIEYVIGAQSRVVETSVDRSTILVSVRHFCVGLLNLLKLDKIEICGEGTPPIITNVNESLGCADLIWLFSQRFIIDLRNFKKGPLKVGDNVLIVIKIFFTHMGEQIVKTQNISIEITPKYD